MSNENPYPLKLDNRFIQNIQGKEFVLYAGLLDLAHQKGLQKLEVKLLQIPNEENHQVAICIAKATSQNGEVYTDVGDANPSNVTKKIAPHIIRMASTRAKGRALRDYCNIGLVCVEELDDEIIQNEYTGNYSSSSNRMNGTSNANETHSGKSNSPSYTKQYRSNGTSRMSEAQRKAIFNLAKRRKMSEDDLYALVENDYSSSMDQLTVQEASNLIQSLQNRN
jgi:hypothetical protein